MEKQKGIDSLPLMKKSSFWYEIKLSVPENEQELLGALLFQDGALGVENRADALLAYFSPDAEIEPVLRRLQAFFPEPGKQARISVQKIPAENWQENWKENFKPLRIGRRFLVTPTWENPENPENWLVLKIDPGMAFGTGTHETTQLVLQLMENRLHPGQRLWDVGTGSGILAIAAARLGLTRIVANDVDADAISAAVENARLNGVTEAISFFTGGPEVLKSGTFDVVLVNVISGIMYRILPDVLSHLASEGTTILSGILTEEQTIFLKKLEELNLEVVESARQGEWLGVVARWK